MNFKDKVIVITGAGRGIGKSLADKFTQAGAQVVASDRADTDVRDEKAVIALAEKTIQKFGRIDIWINNAGVLHNVDSNEELLNMEKAHEVIDTNFFGTVFGCRTAIKYMKKVGDGVIINILSTAALDATRAINTEIYAASKWAVRGYLQAFKNENKDSGVLIYSVYPGGTKTELYRHEDKPASYNDYMDTDSVAEKIIVNFETENPEEELVLRRPTA